MTRASWLHALLFASLATGCGSESRPPPMPDAPMAAPVLVSVTVSPATVVLSLGETQTLMVTGTFDDGSHSAVTDGLAWETSAPGVATVSNRGVATAVAGGSATISVRVGAL